METKKEMLTYEVIGFIWGEVGFRREMQASDANDALNKAMKDLNSVDPAEWELTSISVMDVLVWPPFAYLAVQCLESSKVECFTASHHRNDDLFRWNDFPVRPA